MESFNGHRRDKCLHQQDCLFLNDARFHIERWRRACNFVPTNQL
ncbi:MAG: hypothetical protein IPF98_09720 [Gemmatimonadetes bacterium]|nr:hypothetical protein [Gemmatimonadota bacterium]MCC6772338.1 hypothetical protein [Gemmatimonadaceae bacterium]